MGYQSVDYYDYNNLTTSGSWVYTPSSYSWSDEQQQVAPQKKAMPTAKPAEAWLECELESVMSVGRQERVLA